MNYEEILREKVFECTDKTEEIANRLESAANAGEAEGIEYPAPRKLSLELLGQLSTTVGFARFYNEQFPENEDIKIIEEEYSEYLNEYKKDFQNSLGGSSVAIIKK